MRPDLALPIVYADNALDELGEIADWNEKTYGHDHARRYIAFLEDRIERLGVSYTRGKAVGTRPELRYVIIRRRSKGHGHVVVYKFNHEFLSVLHVFHTAQNWEARISTE